jgi:hypothetical protein
MFNTHLTPEPRLKMSGSMPLLSLHAFMEWTDTTLRVYPTECRHNLRQPLLYCLLNTDHVGPEDG